MRWFIESKAPSIAACAALLIIALSAPAVAQGTAAGTQIQNSATVNYNNSAGAAQPAVTSNTVTVAVTQVAGVSSSPATGATSGAPGATAYYAYSITNSGNGSDTFSLSAVSSHSPAWTVTILKDDGAGGGTANDGIHQAGETNVAASTGALAADGVFKGFMAVAIPAGTANGTSDTETLTAKSQFNASTTATVVGTTTVASAVLTLTKAADVQSAAPGATVTYTLTYKNTGSADATQVAIADSIPANVTYVAGSVTLNGTAKTDAADGDQVTASNGTITVAVGTVTAGTQGTITFKVTVN